MKIHSKVATTSLLSLLALGVIAAVPVSAQTLDVEGTVSVENIVNIQDTGEVDTQGDVSVTSEGEVNSDTRELPSPFGLFFQGMKERLSLMFTFDPKKEAEKRIEFAEKRLDMAEKFAAKSDDGNEEDAERTQERSKQMMLRAHALVAPIASLDVKGDISREQVYSFANKFAMHHERRQYMLEKLEAELSPEQVEKLEEVRVGGKQNFDAMMKVLDNENLPEDVREHLTEIRARIQVHAEAVAEMKEKRDALKERADAGDASAEEDLKALHQEFRTKVQRRQEMREEKRDEGKPRQEVFDAHIERLEEEAAAGDERAQRELDALRLRHEARIEAGLDVAQEGRVSPIRLEAREEGRVRAELQERRNPENEPREDRAKNRDMRGEGRIEISL